MTRKIKTDNAAAVQRHKMRGFIGFGTVAEIEANVVAASSCTATTEGTELVKEEDDDDKGETINGSRRIGGAKGMKVKEWVRMKKTPHQHESLPIRVDIEKRKMRMMPRSKHIAMLRLNQHQQTYSEPTA